MWINTSAVQDVVFKQRFRKAVEMKFKSVENGLYWLSVIVDYLDLDGVRQWVCSALNPLENLNSLDPAFNIWTITYTWDDLDRIEWLVIGNCEDWKSINTHSQVSCAIVVKEFQFGVGVFVQTLDQVRHLDLVNSLADVVITRVVLKNLQAHSGLIPFEPACLDFENVLELVLGHLVEHSVNLVLWLLERVSGEVDWERSAYLKWFDECIWTQCYVKTQLPVSQHKSRSAENFEVRAVVSNLSSKLLSLQVLVVSEIPDKLLGLLDRGLPEADLLNWLMRDHVRFATKSEAAESVEQGMTEFEQWGSPSYGWHDCVSETLFVVWSALFEHRLEVCGDAAFMERARTAIFEVRSQFLNCLVG